MGLFGKLAFWKKEEPLPMPGLEKGPELGLPGDSMKSPELGLPGDSMGGPDLGMPKGGDDALGLPPEIEGGGKGPGGMEMPQLQAESQSAGMPEGFPQAKPAPPSAPVPMPQAQATSGKDIEIISLKLDSLKNTLEAINERLARLEKMAEGGAESRHRF